MMVSLYVSAYPAFLQRYFGSDVEQRSETMVGLTSFSVELATSVYRFRAIEIKLLYNKYWVAIVRAHVSVIFKVEDAIKDFRELLSHWTGILDDDKNMELIIAE